MLNIGQAYTSKHSHWNGKVVTLTKFSSLAAPEVVKMTTSSAASDENFIDMTTFPFQWPASLYHVQQQGLLLLPELRCGIQKFSNSSWFFKGWLKMLQIAFIHIWGLVSQKEASRAGMCDYIPQNLWDVIVPVLDTCFWHTSPHLWVTTQHGKHPIKHKYKHTAFDEYNCFVNERVMIWVKHISYFEHTWYLASCLVKLAGAYCRYLRDIGSFIAKF